MNGKEIEGEEIEIVLAKPPDKKRKERQAARQASRSSAWVCISVDAPSHKEEHGSRDQVKKKPERS